MASIARRKDSSEARGKRQKWRGITLNFPDIRAQATGESIPPDTKQTAFSFILDHIFGVDVGLYKFRPTKLITETHENATDGYVLCQWFRGRKKLGVLGAVAFLFLLFSLVSITGAEVTSNSPSLSGGKVVPESGAWGSIFIYEVVYTDPDNIMPAGEHPLVYIDGEKTGRLMKENDPMDNDVTDGKLYRYEWTPSKENIDNHSFYFYAENPLGENARDPLDNTYSGPEVIKKSVIIDNFEVDIRYPDPGEIITFSGYLKSDNVGLGWKRIDLSEDDNVVESGNTDEDGYFSISIEALSSGAYAYVAGFAGDNHYKGSRLYMEPVITFGALTVSAIFGVFSVALVLALAFLLSRGISRAQYFKPVLIGFLVAMFLAFLLGAGFIGLVVAGAVTGYLYAREVKGWSRHLRAGGLVALFLLLVSCFEIALFIKETAADYVVSIGYSISNTELLAGLSFNVLFSTFIIILWVGLGAVLGGYLRKSLKPKEETEKPGSGVGQPGDQKLA